MKYIKWVLALMLLSLVGLIVFGISDFGSEQVIEIGEDLYAANGVVANPFLLYLFIGLIVFLLFILVLFVIFQLDLMKNEKQKMQNQTLLLANIETLSKTMLEQRQLSY
ncbi:MAG: hypothetical protein LBR35_01540, partial [Rickettsiales bacterium]|nr:hypothetical protein [Rickettsiales bacterium]